MSEQENETCPICMIIYTLPIYKCSNGHSICSTCCRNLQQCPMCRTPYTEPISQNTHLEQQILNGKYPCPNDRIKCPQQFTYNQLVQHRNQCPNAQMLCPLFRQTACAKRDCRSAILEHMVRDHRFRSTENNFYTVKFKHLLARHRVIFPNVNAMLTVRNAYSKNGGNHLNFYAKRVQNENSELAELVIKLEIDKYVFYFLFGKRHCVFCDPTIAHVKISVCRK